MAQKSFSRSIHVFAGPRVFIFPKTISNRSFAILAVEEGGGGGLEVGKGRVIDGGLKVESQQRLISS